MSVVPSYARLPQSGDLEAVELIRVRLPLLEPFESSHGVEADRDVVLVRAIGIDGVSGWGECSTLSKPTYTSEYTEGAWRCLIDEIVPAVFDGRQIELSGRRMAWSAVESAEGDRRLRSEYGGIAAGLPADAPESTPNRIQCGVVVGRCESIEKLIGRVEDFLTHGYVLVKLKVGPGWDLDPLGAVRGRWPDLRLAADANGSYSREHLEHLSRLDSLDLAYLEQPLGADDLDGHSLLRSRLRTPIALDESISCAEDLLNAVSHGALDVVNVKPSRVGGEHECDLIRDFIAVEGLSAFVGGMLETGVGRAFGLHIAAADEFGLPTDLGPSARYFADDITAPFVMRADGAMQVPHSSAGAGGFGAFVIEDRVAEYCVDRLMIQRPMHAPHRTTARR